MTTTLSAPVETARPAIATPTTNTVLDDLVAAVSAYPETDLTIEIFSVGTVGAGDKINEGDEVSFRIRVRNAGPLDVLDLEFLVEAESGATGVKVHGGASFGPSVTTDPIAKVPGHQASGTWTEVPIDYHFLAGAASQGAVVDLVKVSVGAWNAGTDHIFLGHSDPDSKANDVYSHKVLGS